MAFIVGHTNSVKKSLKFILQDSSNISISVIHIILIAAFAICYKDYIKIIAKDEHCFVIIINSLYNLFAT